MQRAPTELLVLQPTPFCNLDCRYCYLPGRDSKARMSQAVLDQVAHVVLRHGQLASEVTVVWHAGEPCVLPAAWYREAMATLQAACPRGTRLTHSFQTNATLIDEAWLALFAEPNVRVGVSLDGPRALHDAKRRTRAGGGTHSQVMAGVAKLQAAGIDFHVIAVLTAASLTQPRELARFFIEAGITQICLNVEEIDGINAATSLADTGIAAAFSRFLTDFFEEIEAADPRPWVRELQFCEQAVLATGLRATAANHQVLPLAILSVDVAGRVSTFSPELLGVPAPDYDDFLFAELASLRRPSDLLRQPAFKRAAAAIEAGRKRCRKSCEYFRWCGGGAPANKLGETGRLDSSETLFCRLTIKTLLSSYLDWKRAGMAEKLAS
ncbi:MAG: cyclophane-forming radical SAM/SPASM peptide maturase GrrM/OscB [Pseudomonadota bacterium]